MPKRAKYFILTLIVIVLAFTWYIKKPVDVSSSDKNHIIRFCVPNNMVSALVVIAQSQGYLKEENIVLDTKPVTNAKMANDLLLANNADMTAAADGPITWVAFTPNILRIVAETMEDGETGIFARKDHSINKESDLVGKQLGYLPGTVSFLYLAEVMEKYHLTLDQFKLSALQPPTMPQALVGGNIDAFVMWEPWGYNAMKQLGDKGIILRQPDLYHYLAVIIGRNDYIEKNPETVKGLLRALVKAEKFILSNKEKSIAIMAEAFKLDPGYLRDNWNLYKFHVQLTDGLVTKLNRNAEMITKYMPDFKDKSKPNFRPLILEGDLKEVDPSRVSIR